MEGKKYAERIGFNPSGREISKVEASLDLSLLEEKNDDYSLFKDKYVVVSTPVSQTCGVYQGTTKERNIILMPSVRDRYFEKENYIINKKELFSDSPQMISKETIIQISPIEKKDLESLLSCSIIEPKVKDKRTDSK